MRRRLAVWLVGSAMLAATSALVGCAVTEIFTPVIVTPHVTYAAGTACDAATCHDVYKHEEPYLGACDMCHNLVSWTQVTYTHKDTSFDNGMHSVVGCAKCHTEGQPVPSGGCVTCHEPPHKGWQSCGSCHTTTAWRMFNAAPDDHLSLKGGHAKLACLDCHTAKVSPATPRQCVSCHGTNHGGLRTCQDCHDPATGWKPKPGWSHNDFFVLRGAHKSLECGQCHEDGRFPGTPKVCVGCHGKQHGGLSDCARCHNTSAFVPPTFKHSSVFTLTGAHVRLRCSRCHPNRAFARNISNGGTACHDCHPSQHGGLTKCAQCHNTSSFDPATKFHHSNFFRLVGVHATLDCDECHPNDRFADLRFTNGTGDWDCVDCHGPHHGNQTQCANCHTPTAWNLTLPIVHPDPTVPLGPAHAWPNPCSRCHVDNVFNTPTRACSECHDAPHVGPTTCTDCHQPTVWSDTHFTHPQILGSLLIPDYQGPAHNFDEFGGYPEGCVQCHVSGGPDPDFTGYSCTIAGCHQ